MPKGVCDDTDPIVMAVDNGRMTVGFRWENTGGIFPDCTGNLTGVSAINTSPNTWYAHFIGRKGTPRTITMPPGFDEQRGRAWLLQRGLDSLEDLENFSITSSSTPPAS